MVDVGTKEVSLRIAVAVGGVSMQRETLDRILTGGVAKGEVLQVARIAGIQGAKRTGDLIPLCHPLGLEAVHVAFQRAAENRLAIFASARLASRTAVSVAALTVYDMCKAIDRGMALGPHRLALKIGGKAPWCRLEGTVSTSTGSPAPDGRVAVDWGTGPVAAGPGLGMLGIPGDMLPWDSWLAFESGHRGEVLKGGTGVRFEAGPPGLPPPGTRVTVRLGDSHGPRTG